MALMLDNRGRPPSPYLAFRPIERLALAGLLIAIVLVAGVVSFFSEGGSHPLLFGAFAVYVLTLSLPLFRSFLGTPALFHPLFFYATWMGLRSLLTGDVVLGATGLEFHRALYGMGSTELEYVAAVSFLLEALSLVSLYVGYGLFRNFKVPVFRPTVVPRRLTVAAVLWMFLPFGAVVILSIEAGGLGSLMLQRGIASDLRMAAEIGGHWNFLAGTGVVVPVVWLAIDRKAARNPVFWGVALLAAFLVFAATGSRSSAIVPFITIALMWSIRNRDIPYKSLWIGAVIAVMAVGILGEFRDATRGADWLGEVQIDARAWDGALRGYDELVRRSTTDNGQIAVLGSVPEHVGHLYGRSYLSIPFVFIPSAIWPGDMPDAAGKLNATYIYDNPLTGIPTGVVGEAYWNFSYLGVVVVFLLFGGVLRLVASLFRKNIDHALVLVFFLYTLTSLAPGSNQVYNFVHAIVPALLFYFFVHLISKLRYGGVSVSSRQTASS